MEMKMVFLQPLKDIQNTEGISEKISQDASFNNLLLQMEVISKVQEGPFPFMPPGHSFLSTDRTEEKVYTEQDNKASQIISFSSDRELTEKMRAPESDYMEFFYETKEGARICFSPAVLIPYNASYLPQDDIEPSY